MRIVSNLLLTFLLFGLVYYIYAILGIVLPHSYIAIACVSIFISLYSVFTKHCTKTKNDNCCTKISIEMPLIFIGSMICGYIGYIIKPAIANHTNPILLSTSFGILGLMTVLFKITIDPYIDIAMQQKKKIFMNFLTILGLIIFVPMLLAFLVTLLKFTAGMAISIVLHIILLLIIAIIGFKCRFANIPPWHRCKAVKRSFIDNFVASIIMGCIAMQSSKHTIILSLRYQDLKQSKRGLSIKSITDPQKMQNFMELFIQSLPILAATMLVLSIVSSLNIAMNQAIIRSYVYEKFINRIKEKNTKRAYCILLFCTLFAIISFSLISSGIIMTIISTFKEGFLDLLNAVISNAQGRGFYTWSRQEMSAAIFDNKTLTVMLSTIVISVITIHKEVHMGIAYKYLINPNGQADPVDQLSDDKSNKTMCMEK